MDYNTPTRLLVSGCLLGLCTRYDASIKENPQAHKLLDTCLCIPVCPEQLGGLPTPRPAADIHGGDGHDVLAGTAKVLTKTGEDVTSEFIAGARQVAEIARILGCTGAVLKARSPSCAVQGTIGVTAALLQQQGLTLQEF